MNQSSSAILCVDDDRDNRELLAFVFEQEGFEVKTCGTISDCLFQAKETIFSAIVLDNHFRKTNGVEICREIRWFDPITPIIFYSGEARQSEIEKALAAGANAYLVKPKDFERLTETVSKLIKERRAGS